MGKQSFDSTNHLELFHILYTMRANFLPDTENRLSAKEQDWIRRV